MIKSIVHSAPKFTGKEEVIVVPVFEDAKNLNGSAKKLDVLCKSSLSRTLKNGHFKASLGETALLALHFPKAPQHALLIGLGKKSAIDPENAARAAGSASKLLKKHRFKTGHVLLNEDVSEFLQEENLHAFLKGFILAQYEFTLSEKPKPTATVRKLVIMSNSSNAVTPVIRRARIVADHAQKVCDLVNLPANLLTPNELANEAKALAKDAGVQCRIMGLRELEKLNMGSVLSVAKGSREEPRFITLHYNKGKGDLRVCLVGKAVTFDSGGISIKPWLNMNEMKGDMAGGAVVLNVVAAAARLKLPIELIGLVPAVENMPDGTAFRPGDVIDTYSGKTIEILSTDAEGRLILADALTYAQEFEPDLIVDMATLTGAIVIALGTRVAGIMGNDQEYIDLLREAGKETGEPVWQLPLDDTFYSEVKGDISDYKNYSGRDGSAITAGALLGQFVGGIPWIHMDIAGTFWSNGGTASYHGKGATGYGVDLMLRFLESLVEEED